MSKTTFSGKNFSFTRTVETKGPHITLLSDHYEDSYMITVLIRGGGKCYIEGNCYELCSGDIIAVSQEEIHSFHFDQNSPHERFSIYFSENIIAPLIDYQPDLMSIFTSRPLGIGNVFSQKEYANSNISEILDEFCQISRKYNNTFSPIEQARLHILILGLLFGLYDCCNARNFSVNCLESNSDIPKICRYINDNLTDDLSYQSIQKKFYVSRHHLSVLFLQNTGITFTEYVLQKRLNRVSALVKQGYTISSAAEAAGFSNYSNFYKIFVKRKKVSPQKYYSSKKDI